VPRNPPLFIYVTVSQNILKEHLQILDTKKFLKIILIGSICWLTSFVFTFLKIGTWGFYTWLFLPQIIMFSFFLIGIYFSKDTVAIEINSGYYEFGKRKFRLIDIYSYNVGSSGYSHRVSIILKNYQKISLTILNSSHDKDKFLSLVDRILNDIKDYNSNSNSDKILEYDPLKTKGSKIFGVLLIIFDLILTYFTISNYSKSVPIQLKYFGAIIINLLILSFVHRIFKKK